MVIKFLLSFPNSAKLVKIWKLDQKNKCRKFQIGKYERTNQHPPFSWSIKKMKIRTNSKAKEWVLQKHMHLFIEKYDQIALYVFYTFVYCFYWIKRFWFSLTLWIMKIWTSKPFHAFYTMIQNVLLLYFSICTSNTSVIHQNVAKSFPCPSERTR